MRKFNQLIESFKQRGRYYVDKIADEAIRKSDYDIAFKYYQEAYLISGSRQIITKIQELKDTVEGRRLPPDLKLRIVTLISDYLNSFKK